MLTLQLKTTARIKDTTDRKGEIVTVKFAFGPLLFVVISHIPAEGMLEATAYVKLETIANSDWMFFDDRKGDIR